MKSIKVAVTTWDKTETASTSFAEAIKELGFARALKGANIRRTPRNRDGKDDAEKRSAYCMFLHFLMVIFHADNFFQFLGTKRADEAAAKSTSYRFLEDKSYNWRKLVALVAVNAIKLISGLTLNIRIKCFILDDSVISRSRAKMA